MSQRHIVFGIIGVVALLCIFGVFLQLRSALEPIEVTELKLQNQTAALNYQTEKLRLSQKITESAEVQWAVKARVIFWQLLPIIALFAGFFAFVMRPMPFECAGVKAHVSRWNERPVLQSALLVSAMSEQTKALAFQDAVANARADTLVKFAHAIRPGRERLHISSPMTTAALSEPVAETTPNVPTFHQAQSDFKPGAILLGYSANKPTYLPIHGFVSCAFGGGSGSGKTSKLRFLLAQLILQGVNVSILDAHMGNKESLVDSLGDMATRSNVRVFHPFDTRQAVDTMLADVQAAIDGRRNGVTPTVFVLDELRPLNRACNQIEILMDKIANEGRKYGFYGVFSSQTWEAKMFDRSGSAARDACVLKMAARMPKEQARTLFKDGESARTVAKLAQPEMYADAMQFNGVVTVPFASRDDMNVLAASTTAKAHTAQPSLPFAPHPFDTALRDLKSQMSIEDIYRKSGLCNGMTLATFETKCKPSSRRTFTASEEAAILGIQ